MCKERLLILANTVCSPAVCFKMHRVKSWFAFESNYLEDTFVFPEVFVLNPKLQSLMVVPTVHQALSDAVP